MIARGWALRLMTAMVVSASFASALVTGAPPALAGEHAPRPLTSWNWASKAFAVTQGSDGFLWVGTDKGLLRFDGRDVRIMNPAQSLGTPGPAVGALFGRPGGTLMVGLRDSGVVARLRDGRFESVARLGSVSVQALVAQPSGVVWAGTDRGLFRVKDGLVQQIGAADLDVRALAVDPQGRLLVAGMGGLLVGPVDGESLQRLSAITHVRAVAADATGTLWVAARDGLHRLRAGEPNPERFLASVDERGLSAVAVDRDDRVWVGWEKGFARVRADLQGIETHHRSASVVALHEDVEGNVWAVEYWGTVTRIGRPLVETHIVHESPGRPPTVFAALPTPVGTWVSARQQIGLHRDGQWTRFALGTMIPSWCARSLAWDGALWVGACKGAVIRFDGTRAKEVRFPEAYGEDSARPLVFAGDGALWVGLRQGAVLRLRDGVFTPFVLPGDRCPGAEGPTLAEECPLSVLSLAPDDDGGVWLATRGAGLFHMSGDGRVRAIGDFPERRLLALLLAPDGALWIGTHGRGLWRRKSGVALRVPDSAGVPGTISGILLDRDDRLWLSSDRGAHHIPHAWLLAHLAGDRNAGPATHYGLDEGMPSLITMQGFSPAIAQDENGDVLLPTKAGLAVIAPPRPLPYTPAVRIESIEVDGEPLPKSAEVALQFRRAAIGVLSVRFTAPSFRAARQVRYEYRLLGHRDDWTHVSGTDAARFHSVGPGAYTFEIRARVGPDQSATDIAMASIHVIGFYQRPLFFALLGGLGLIVVLVLHRARLLLERARFAAITRERNRMAHDLHDTLAQHFTALTYQVQTLQALSPADNRDVREVVDETKQILAQARLEARHAVANLRNQGLGKHTLQSALEELVSWARTHAEVTLTSAKLELSDEAQGQLARIAQEAVSNAIAHGHARHIDIALALDANGNSLSVRDDGVGFHPQDAPDGRNWHFGLVGMNERAAKAGGVLSVKSAPGQGTTVSVTVPHENVLRKRNRQQQEP